MRSSLSLLAKWPKRGRDLLQRDVVSTPWSLIMTEANWSPVHVRVWQTFVLQSVRHVSSDATLPRYRIFEFLTVRQTGLILERKREKPACYRAERMQDLYAYVSALSTIRERANQALHIRLFGCTSSLKPWSTYRAEYSVGNQEHLSFSVLKLYKSIRISLFTNECACSWRQVDSIPLSRQKKSFARDFADGGIFVTDNSLSSHLIYQNVKWKPSGRRQTCKHLNSTRPFMHTLSIIRTTAEALQGATFIVRIHTVLAAEIIHHELPHIVELHNYSTAHSSPQKLWDLSIHI